MRRVQLAIVTALLSAAAIFAVVASASPPKAGKSYAGKTSQGQRVSFAVARDRESIRGFRIERHFRCRRGSERSSLTGVFRQDEAPLTVGKDGRFHGHGKLRGSDGSLIKSGRICVRGGFSRGGRVARGKLREKVRLTDGSLCATGLVRFVVRVR